MTDTPETMKAACTNCGAVYMVGRDKAGRQARCVKCMAPFIISEVPTPGDPAPADKAGPAAAMADPKPRVTPFQVDTTTICPRCGHSFPVSSFLTGRSIPCPKCKQYFPVGHEGPLPEPEPTLFEKLMHDRRAIWGAVALGVILVGLFAWSFIRDARREGRLMAALAETYQPPNYTVTRIKPPPGGRKIIQKTADGSRECAAVAFVHIAHQPTGMEFDRVLCEFGGRWAPTFRQRVADQVAAKSLAELDGEGTYSDFGDLVYQVYDKDATNLKELYDTAMPEETEVALQSGLAFEALTHGREWSASSYGQEDGDEEDEGGDGFDFSERLYLAHAVMYPDEAEALYQAGKISKKP